MLAGHSISQTLQVLSGEGSSERLGKSRPAAWEFVLKRDDQLTAQNDGDEFDADFDEDEDDDDDDFEDDLDEFEDDFDEEFDDDDDDDDDFEEEDF